MNDLSNYRKSYDKSELLESSIPDNPISLLPWFHEVETLEEIAKLMP
jgi:pyridoxamine 5'-phosphate oxidase